MRYASAALLTSLALAACATTPGAETVDVTPAELQHSSAILFVERQGTDPTNGTAHVGARFVQYAGVTSDSLPDLLGTPHIPGTSTGCSERTDSAVDSSNGRAEVRLMDVGPIDVRAGDRMLHLEPRRFPDLWNVVSGVVYATDGDLPSDNWHFAAPGNAQSHMPAFDVEARAPEDLVGISIADQAFVANGIVSIPRRGFSIRWTRGERDDGVIVAFESAGTAEHASTISCAARDEGSLDIDNAWADRIVALAQSGATVTVHRVRARAFNAPQVDSANVVFDLSIRGRAQLE